MRTCISGIDQVTPSVRSFVAAVPLAALALAIAVIVAFALSPRLARSLHTSRAIAALLLMGFGLVLAATLTPDAAAFAGDASDGTCDVSRIGLAPMSELTRISAASLNVLLFIPLGIAIGLLPRTRAAAVVTIAAIALTFFVETVQLLVTVLGRGCQTADLADNLLGLAIGIVIGATAGWLFARMPRSQA
jgi:VanZ family protein